MVSARAIVAAALLLSFAACTTDYQKGLADPSYGAPNALAGSKQPGPVTDAGPTGTWTNAPVCWSTLVDGGPCSVKFSTDILPALSACTSTACHGGATPANQPRIDPTDAPGMWSGFSAFKLSNGKPYINPCSTDPAQAAMSCNVNKAAPCGTVMPPGLGLAADVVTKMDTWLKCGSPNN
jgi:hypothetical protein